MNIIFEYQHLIILLMAVTFFANFCGLGLWLFLSVYFYSKTAQKIQREEIEYQLEKHRAAIAACKEMNKPEADDNFGSRGGRA